MLITSHKLGKALCDTREKGYRYRIHHTHKPQRKLGRHSSRHFTQDEARMARKHTRRDRSHPLDWSRCRGWQRADKKAEHGESLDSAAGAEMGSVTLKTVRNELIMPNLSILCGQQFQSQVWTSQRLVPVCPVQTEQALL